MYFCMNSIGFKDCLQPLIRAVIFFVVSENLFFRQTMQSIMGKAKKEREKFEKTRTLISPKNVFACLQKKIVGDTLKTTIYCQCC